MRAPPPQTTRHGMTAAAVLVLANAIAAINVTVVHYAVGYFEPLAFAGLRSIVATVVVLVWATWREGFPRIRRTHLSLLVITALVGISINQLTFVYTMRISQTSLAAILLATTPLFVAVIARALRIEAVNRGSWLGVALGFTGVLIIAVAGEGRSGQGVLAAGLALGSTAGFAVFLLLIRTLLHSYRPITLTALLMAIGSVPLVVGTVAQAPETDWSAIPVAAWLELIYSAVLALAFTYTVYVWSIRTMGATRMAVFAYLQPVVAAVVAVLVTGERPSPLAACGSIVVIVGLVVTGRFGRSFVRADHITPPI